MRNRVAETGALRVWTGLAVATTVVTGATGAALALGPGGAGVAGAGAWPDAGWRVPVQAESGEAGESGMVRGQSPDLAYALRLALVEAHLRAAVEVYRAGMVPEALGLAGHPEAEVMDELRDDLAARGLADFSDAMDAMMAAIGAEAPVAEVEAAFAQVATAIAASYGDTPARARMDAAVMFARQAATEYAGITAGGVVAEPATYLETQAMIAVARGLVAPLADSADPAVADAAAQALAVLEGAAEAWSPAGTPPEARDTTILYGVAAWLELAGLRVAA